MLKRIIFLTISVKIFIFLLIIIGFYTLPFHKNNYQINFHYPEKEPITLQTAFKTWDAQHYLYLSEFWYKPNHPSNTFYPLFPVLIRLLTPPFQNSLIVALFISNLLSIAGIIYFYLFAKDYFKNNSRLAFLSVVLLLAFPTAFYFSLIYSESLFFILTIIFFYYLYKKKFKLASIFALLLPLSRPTGILLLIPFAFYTLNYLYLLFPKLTLSQRVNKILIDKRIFLLFSPIIGFLVYLFIMYLSTSSVNSGFTMQKNYLAGWRMENILHPDIFLNNLLSPLPVNHSYLNSALDRGFFIIFIILLYYIYKKLDRTLFIYTLTIGFVPLFGSFMSYTRYLLLALPVFMVSAVFFNSKNHTLYKALVLIILTILQIIFLISHTLNHWIA